MNGYLLVRADGLQCGIPATAVQRVLDVDEVHAAPSGHAAFLGVIPFQGGMVPFVHLRAVLDRRADRPTAPPTAVVVRCGGKTVALGVDDAEAVVRERPEARPAAWQLSWASGVARREDALVPIVDLEVLADRLGTTKVSEAR